MGRVTVTSRVKEWSSEKAVKLDVALLQVATDIHRVASMAAPKASRALVNSGRIERKGPASYAVIFGGGAVPYARRRHFENKKNPQTLLYLSRSGDAAVNNLKRYFKGL